MSYTVELTPKAREQLSELPRFVQKAIGKRIDRLIENARPPDSKKLKGQDGFYRVKAAKDYRIVYQIEDERLIVLVVRIGNRKEVYRNLPLKMILGR